MNKAKTQFYTVCKKVPIPHVRNSAGDSLLSTMKVGDMFNVPAKEFIRNTWYQRANKLGIKVASRKLSEHTYGIWRIK